MSAASADPGNNAAQLGRLPEKDREQCLDLFKELYDSTPGEQVLAVLRDWIAGIAACMLALQANRLRRVTGPG